MTVCMPCGCVSAVYVLDTGVRTSHVDFKGRVGAGASSVGSSVMDDNGHGTHVAGISLGGIHGVAKSAILHPVKVGCRSNACGVHLGSQWACLHSILPAVCAISTTCVQCWCTTACQPGAWLEHLVCLGALR